LLLTCHVVDFIIFCVVSAQTLFNNLIDFIYKSHGLFKPFAYLFRLDLHEIPVIALLSEVIHARELTTQFYRDNAGLDEVFIEEGTHSRMFRGRQIFRMKKGC